MELKEGIKISYIKLPNITTSKLQDVVDYLDNEEIEYVEYYEEDLFKLETNWKELKKWLEEEIKIQDVKYLESWESGLKCAYKTVLNKMQ